MAINDLATPFPLVDADPHAKRVIKYFRGSDYALWAAGTAAAPAAVYAFGASRARSLFRCLSAWQGRQARGEGQSMIS